MYFFCTNEALFVFRDIFVYTDLYRQCSKKILWSINWPFGKQQKNNGFILHNNFFFFFFNFWALQIYSILVLEVFSLYIPFFFYHYYNVLLICRIWKDFVHLIIKLFTYLLKEYARKHSLWKSVTGNNSWVIYAGQATENELS